MCEELHDPFTDQVECARFRAERDMLAQAMERVADDIERTFLGFEGAEDAPAMRWAREFRSALGSLHAPGFQKSQKVATSLTPHSDASDVTMSAYDLLPEEEREALAWVRGQGGLDEVNRKVAESMQQADEYIALRCSLAERAGDLYEMLDKEDDELVALLDKRLMPEGMEWLFDVWPKWSNGEYCKFGDWWKAEKYGEREPQQLCRLVFFTPEQLREWGQDEGENFGYEWDYMRPRDTTYRPDKVEPPAPKVLDADGVEIRVGDTVYEVDTGDEFLVQQIYGGTTEPDFPDHTVRCSKSSDFMSHMFRPEQLTHQRPVLDADGVPTKKGDTVWHIKTGREYVVVEPSYGETVVVRLAKYDDAEGEQYAPDELTHTKPEQRDARFGPRTVAAFHREITGGDSWERVEEDARGLDSGVDRGLLTHTHEDIARRCKELAERGEL